MKHQNSLKTLKPIDAVSENSNIRIGTARFIFENGDSYEGKYQTDIDRRILVKQDQGMYLTDNFDVYDGKWCDDKFANGEFYIRYNNNAQYKGEIEANGIINGRGTYIFPDGSLLSALWSQNKPISDVTYKESLGHEWTTELISDNQILFTTGNHFWNELCKASSEETFSSLSRH
ncbi:radial spoke head 1 homolog [Linepithema humile]|uniref:radial spoke head 1 homolog n=1 Tax=Linepithema humile TaxID=83485 RepID=UPI00351ED165